MQQKYLLFDLDGTLTDPAEGITNSVMYALEKFGIVIKNREELFPYIGPPLTASFMQYHGLSASWGIIASILAIRECLKISRITVLIRCWRNFVKRVTRCWLPPQSPRNSLCRSCNIFPWISILLLLQEIRSRKRARQRHLSSRICANYIRRYVRIMR